MLWLHAYWQRLRPCGDDKRAVQGTTTRQGRAKTRASYDCVHYFTLKDVGGFQARDAQNTTPAVTKMPQTIRKLTFQR